MSTYEKLRAKIQSACPELLELGVREKLAELKHNQWVEWSKQIADLDNLSEKRLGRWKYCWIPYRDLSETDKDDDRKWADKVIKILGREPGLAEVLKCLGEKYAFDGSGMLLERQYGTSAYDCAGMTIWDLTKTLKDQKPETLLFLDKILS